MKNIKKILLALSFTVLFACGKTEKTETVAIEVQQEKEFKIGITQIVTHPALDAAKNGFKKALEDAGIKASFDEQNAEGAIANANLIATNFAADKKDLIFGIATPSVQALTNNIKDTPILFSAVTDPVEAGIMNENVTGTSDKLDNIKDQLELLKKLKPEVKSIGIIYNTSEQNNLSQIKEVENAAKTLGIEIILQGITSFTELSQATSVLFERADALYVTTDNLVASGIQLIATEALNVKKPVVVADSILVQPGILFSIGLEYYDLGYRAGEMAVEILNGKVPKDIPFETAPKLRLYISEKTVKTLGLDMDSPLLKNAEIRE